MEPGTPEVGEEIEFRIENEDDLQGIQPRYRWDFGDGSAIVEVQGSATVTHTYPDSGSYTVTAELFDAEDVLLARATYQIDVRLDPGEWVGWVNTTSDVANGTTYFEARDVRWTFAGSPAAGWWTYLPTSGQLTYWRVVPCADYVSAVAQVDLATAVQANYTWFYVSQSGDQAPAGSEVEASFWYQGVANASGLQVMNKVCPTDTHPNPEEYLFLTGFNFFKTWAGSVAELLPSHDWDVIEGTNTEVRGGFTTTCTWRFERVYE